MDSRFFCYPSPVFQQFQVPIQTKPMSGKINDMRHSWPQWQSAMEVAQKCMASLYINGSYRGMGVFVKSDELLIPRHLISAVDSSICGENLDNLLDTIWIHYDDGRYCYVPSKVLYVVSDGVQKDYCIVKLAKAFPCTIPERSSNSSLAECLFAEILEDSQVMISIVSPCSISSELMCGSTDNWTRPGSSGGVYFDLSGKLIAIHIGQATGLCYAHTGRERKLLYAHEIFEMSLDFRKLSLSSSLRLTCLSPALSDPCYNQQADVRTKTEIDDKGYYCESREQHITNSERGLQIDLKQVTQDKKTKKHIDRKIVTLFYQIFLIDIRGNERSNIHHSKGSPSSYTAQSAPHFYRLMTQIYQRNISNLGITASEFRFDFKEYNFTAKLLMIDGKSVN